MADSLSSCPSCGARVAPETERCDLCGAPLDRPSDPDEESAQADPEAPVPSDSPGDDADPETGTSAPQHVFCNQCGHQNPADANYCSRCGAELQDLTRPTASEETRPVTADLPAGAAPDADSSSPPPDAQAPDDQGDDPADEETRAAVGRQLLWMVGVGLCVVIGFFFVTQWSQQYEWGGNDGGSGPPAAAGGGGAATSAAPGSGPAASSPSGSGSASAEAPDTDLETLVSELSGEVDGPVADKIDSLRALEREADGKQRRQARAQLVRMYTGAGASGRAALVQRRLADATGSADDRRRAADLLYRWMRQVEQENDRARVADVARHVAAAYEAVAQERAQDLDARTRMGEAYLLTNNPMEGIRTINEVLAEDSTFVPARFQKGLALLQVNRLDEAIREFQMVKEYAESGQPFYRQADRAIEVINKRSAAGDSGPSGP